MFINTRRSSQSTAESSSSKRVVSVQGLSDRLGWIHSEQLARRHFIPSYDLFVKSSSSLVCKARSYDPSHSNLGPPLLTTTTSQPRHWYTLTRRASRHRKYVPLEALHLSHEPSLANILDPCQISLPLKRRMVAPNF